MAKEKLSLRQTMSPGEIVVVDNDGVVQHREASPGMTTAQRLELTRPVVFQEHDPETYVRPFDGEVAAFKEGRIQLREMTPSYAYAMIWKELKSARTGVKTFRDEIFLARLWQERLEELAVAFGLPEGHISIDTSGPILHVHPVEESEKTPGPNGHPLHFATLGNDDGHFLRDVGRGYEAILPTHVQASGYATPAHPEMHSSLAAIDAIPSLRIGKYVRVGGSFNPQGSEGWVFGDNSWLGQGCYFISQEHPADLPAQLARTSQYTSFPGMQVGAWAWIAKQAQVLYRTQYIGEGAVVASHAKINTWVSDHSLVTSDGQHAFYPVKAYVLDTLGIRDTQDVLALDWRKVEAKWQQEYEAWRQEEHVPDGNIAEALTTARENPRSRVLFIGSRNEANILHAAAPNGGANPLRRIDVMTVDQTRQAYTMQALNGMRNRNTRFGPFRASLLFLSGIFMKNRSMIWWWSRHQRVPVVKEAEKPAGFSKKHRDW